MKRVFESEAMYKTKNVEKNLERFAKRFPEAAAFCEFGSYDIEEMKKSLPITDKYLADGTVNDDWHYFFDIDFEQVGMYIWYIEREENKNA